MGSYGIGLPNLGTDYSCWFLQLVTSICQYSQVYPYSPHHNGQRNTFLGNFKDDHHNHYHFHPVIIL